jgi:hypothetical protein
MSASPPKLSAKCVSHAPRREREGVVAGPQLQGQSKGLLRRR